MIYTLFRFIFASALEQFFSAIQVKGERVENGPVLVVANHQNFALDSLLVTYGFKRSLWYLGKATIFKNPILGALLRSLHVAPLFRRQDDPSQMSKNEETFKAVEQLLHLNRAVLLFPEGISLGERKLQPVKTGASRMAFLAESAKHFSLGLKIQPVGLTYSDLRKFRSAVTIVYGRPIEVQSFEKVYHQDQREAVKQLTDAIEASLKEFTVEIEHKDLEVLVEKIASVYRSRRSGLDERERFALIASNVQKIGSANPTLKEQFESKIDAYLDLCRFFSLDGEDVLEPHHHQHWVLNMALLPIVLLGVLVHGLPYKFIARIAGRCAHPVYESSTKFLWGIVVFPFWYLILSLAFGILTGSWVVSVSTLVLLATVGLFTNKYIDEISRFVLSKLWIGRKKPLEFLVKERDKLIAELEAVRVK